MSDSKLVPVTFAALSLLCSASSAMARESDSIFDVKIKEVKIEQPLKVAPITDEILVKGMGLGSGEQGVRLSQGIAATGALDMVPENFPNCYLIARTPSPNGLHTITPSEIQKPMRVVSQVGEGNSIGDMEYDFDARSPFKKMICLFYTYSPTPFDLKQLKATLGSFATVKTTQSENKNFLSAFLPSMTLSERKAADENARISAARAQNIFELNHKAHARLAE